MLMEDVSTCLNPADRAMQFELLQAYRAVQLVNAGKMFGQVIQLTNKTHLSRSSIQLHQCRPTT